MNLGLGSACLQPEGLVELDFCDDQIIDIALSEKHGLAVSQMGGVWTWGRSYSGENGKPGSNIINEPARLDLSLYMEIDTEKMGFNTVFCNKYSSVVLGGEGGVILGK